MELKDDADFARVKKQADNLKLHLGLDQKPLIASQAGYVSIDVQRSDRQAVPLAPLLTTPPAGPAGRPVFPAGVDVGGRTHWLDLSDPGACHLLIAGTTGSGKSEFLKALIAGLAARLGPDEVHFLLIDPKQVTFHLHGVTPCRDGAKRVSEYVPAKGRVGRQPPPGVPTEPGRRFGEGVQCPTGGRRVLVERPGCRVLDDRLNRVA